MPAAIGTVIEEGVEVIERIIRVQTSKSSVIGATGGQFPVERSATQQTQRGAAMKIGAVFEPYDPELVAKLGLE